MPSYLFAAPLLSLLVFCALSGVASANSANMSIELFEKGSIDVLKPGGGDGKEKLNLMIYFPPSVVGVTGVMVGLVEGVLTNGPGKPERESEHVILAKYIGTGNGWGDKAMETKGENWQTQLVFKGEKSRDIFFTSAARNNSVYVIYASKPQSTDLSPANSAQNGKWEFKLIVGTITGSDDAEKKKIDWKVSDVFIEFVREDIQKHFKGVSTFNGYSFSMENETLVFVLTGRRDHDKCVSVSARLEDSSKGFALNYLGTTIDCDSNLFSWGNQLFMVPKGDPRGNNNRRLKVSNDTGNTWVEASGPLAKRLNNFTKRRESFTTLNIDGKRVLLFTEDSSIFGHSVPADSPKNVELNLVVANENHTEDLGTILTTSDYSFDGSFWYANNELFFLSVQSTTAEKVILTRLTQQLGRIRELLKEWYPAEKEETKEEKEDETDVQDQSTHSEISNVDVPSHTTQSEISNVDVQDLPTVSEKLVADEQNHTTPRDNLTTEASVPKENDAKDLVKLLVNESMLANKTAQWFWDSSVRAHVSVAVVLLCVLFGMWAPVALW